ncbi:methylenetetrahydrofolate reductase [Amycolatopsis pithecellobii]|uniref:methylenetetrahydrofolate reductase n=1 Tax=Amycolatopsis pithecellobii TaxID=664692 RepID=UPI001AA048F0|nr:methylenetetrahydrofolate reductase [Amycolatopsis pithecellobii]
MSPTDRDTSRVSGLLHDFSLEITGKDVGDLQKAAAGVPQGTRVNVTFLANEQTSVRVRAAEVIKGLGFRPVPHISARRLTSRDELDRYLSALAEIGATEDVVVIAGDPAHPAGPFADSLAVIASGALTEYGVRSVDIAGYPEGHPKIHEDVLWRAVEEKTDALRARGLDYSVATQFVFDAATVVRWIEQLRGRGIDGPVRIGVPGPAGVQRLLRYAKRFGVSSSASVVQKYGFSLTGLLGTAGPARFIADLQSAIDPALHGEILLHFYTFGGVRATAEWVRTALSGEE